MCDDAMAVRLAEEAALQPLVKLVNFNSADIKIGCTHDRVLTNLTTVAKQLLPPLVSPQVRAFIFSLFFSVLPFSRFVSDLSLASPMDLQLSQVADLERTKDRRILLVA